MINLFIGTKQKQSLKSVVYLQQLFIALLLLVLVTVIGTVGYIMIEGYSIIEAIYMTIITLSTVGFTEVRPLSDAGRLFTSILIIFNIAVFAYSVSILSRFIIEGDFRKILIERTMKKKIDQLENHVIICGYGRYGMEISKRFLKFGNSFVVIENAPQKIEELREDADIMHIEGDSTHDEVLVEAGIDRARVLVTTLNEDADNVYVVLTAKQLNPRLNIISRGSAINSESKLKRAGANHVIMPELIGGFYMASLVRKPDTVDFFQLMTEQEDTGVSFSEIVLNELPPSLQNKSLKEINSLELTGANVVALKSPHGDYIINPSPQTMIEPNMGIFIMGTNSQIQNFQKLVSE
ncbi:MAG: potassium channel protein [Bacteroidia bacterium]|nr:potassium channel protein [Bacteroidia bacterium]NNC85204.1 potassium channel protein [Bacteroidia bacterium]NNM16908.1 potassium channel protein [Bacteroidia bacterium]